MVQVRGHVFVYHGSSKRSCICIVLFKLEVMYLYTTVQVISHVFVYYGSSDQSYIVYHGSSKKSCICIVLFKKGVIVFVYYGSSDQSCICILWFKWSVMYLYTTVQVSSHVFCVLKVSPLSLSTMFLILNYFPQCGIFLLDFEPFPTVWYFSIRFWTISDSVVFFY